VVLAAADSAQLTTMPVCVRVVARPMRDGHLLAPIPVKKILLMVVSPGKS